MKTTRRNFLASIPFLATLFGIRKAEPVDPKLQVTIEIDTTQFIEGIERVEKSLLKLERRRNLICTIVSKEWKVIDV